MLINRLDALSCCSFSLFSDCWSPYRTTREMKMVIFTHCILIVDPLAEERPMSSKVIDFGANWKRICNFLLVINGNF